MNNESTEEYEKNNYNQIRGIESYLTTNSLIVI